MGFSSQGSLDRQPITGTDIQQGASTSDHFTISFCNICRLKSNLSSVEHHLASASPDQLFLSESQLPANPLSDLYKINDYNLYPLFRQTDGVCTYCTSNISVTRLMDLESPSFDVIWLKISLDTICIFICFLYLSPNLNSSQPFLLTP